MLRCILFTGPKNVTDPIVNRPEIPFRCCYRACMSTVDEEVKSGPYGVPIGITVGVIAGLAFGSMTQSLGIWIIGGLLLGTVGGLMYNRKVR